jgi:hypothetical protein
MWLLPPCPPPPFQCSVSRFFALLGTVWLLAGPAHAQVGVRAGGDWMAQSPAPGDRRLGAASVNTRSQAGYHVGGYYVLPLGKRYALVPEVQFSRERARVETASGSPVSDAYRSDYQLRLSYVNLPVLARLALGPVYLEAGPQLSFLVGGRGDGATVVTPRTNTTGAYALAISQAATDRYRRVDAGLCLGVGVRLPAGLGLNVRAYQGFVPLNRTDAPYTPSEIPYTANREYRQTLQAAVSYQRPVRP